MDIERKKWRDTGEDCINEELNNLYISRIIRTIKSRRM
jgi:hypothetical protein